MSGERYVAGFAALGLILCSWSSARWAVRRLGTAMEPVGLFCFSWGLALALFAIPWVRFTSSSTEAWLAVYGSITCFIVGACAAYGYLPVPPRAGKSSACELDHVALRIAFALMTAMTLVGFLAYARAVDATVGWRLLFTSPEIVRQAETMSEQFSSTYGLWKLFSYVGQPAFLVWTIALRTGALRGRWSWLIPLGVLTIAPYALMTNRVLLLTTIGWAALFHLTWKPITRLQTMALVLLSSAAVALGAFLVLGARTNKTIDRYPEVAAALTNQTLSDVAIPYIYVAGAVPVLTQFMADPNLPRTRGSATALPVVKALDRAGLHGTPPDQIKPYYPIPFESFNTSPWISDFYLDWRLPGTWILPCLFGLGIAWLARWNALRPSLLGAWWLSLLLLAVAMTPFTNKFTSALTWELLALGLIVSPLVHGRGPGIRDLSGWALSVRRRLSMKLVVALAAVVVIGGVLLGIAVTGTSEDPASASHQNAVGGRMLDAAGRAKRVFTVGGYPSAATLASQLHQSDPATRFVAIRSKTALPSEAGTIGVFTTADVLWLRARTRGGPVLEVRQVAQGKDRGTYGPVSVTRSVGLRNGNFSLPWCGNWFVSESPMAKVGLTRAVSLSRPSSPQATGTGKRGDPGIVIQESPSIESNRDGQPVSAQAGS